MGPEADGEKGTTIETGASTPPEVNRGDLTKALQSERASASAAKKQVEGLQAKLDAITAEQAKASEAKMAEDGQFKELLAKRDAELASAQTELTGFKEREATRLDQLRERNAKGLQGLPDGTSSFIAAAMGARDDPDHLALLIGQASALMPAAAHPEGGRVGGGSPAPDANALTPEAKKWFQAHRPQMLGKSTSESALMTYYRGATRKAGAA